MSGLDSKKKYTFSYLPKEKFTVILDKLMKEKEVRAVLDYLKDR